MTKARLIAKGFEQEYGVEFDKMFSPVVKVTTLRFLLSIIAFEKFELIQLDVRTTFPHGDLEEEIDMEQPKGFVISNQESLVYRLKKSIYAMKQASR